MTYFLDANIISYILKNIPSVVDRIREIISEGNEIRIPAISYYEIKRWLIQNNSQRKLAIFEKQVENFGIVQMKTETYDIAAKIYADLSSFGKIIEDSDIFIGSITIEHQGILLTNNARHLGRIPDLKYEVVS